MRLIPRKTGQAMQKINFVLTTAELFLHFNKIPKERTNTLFVRFQLLLHFLQWTICWACIRRLDILWFRHDSLPAVKIGWDYFRAESGWNSLVHQLSFCDMYRAVARIRNTSRVFVIKIPSRNPCPLVCDSVTQFQLMITN